MYQLIVDKLSIKTNNKGYLTYIICDCNGRLTNA